MSTGLRMETARQTGASMVSTCTADRDREPASLKGRSKFQSRPGVGASSGTPSLLFRRLDVEFSLRAEPACKNGTHDTGQQQDKHTRRALRMFAESRVGANIK